MKPWIMLFLLGIGLFLRGFLTPPAVTSAPLPTPTFSSTLLEEKVNQWRVEQGLSQLPEEESLCKYAQKRVAEIKTIWNHDQFRTDACTLTDFAACGENLSKGFNTEETTLTGWVNSPTHKANLQENWSNMCIHCEDGYCAQEFGV